MFIVNPVIVGIFIQIVRDAVLVKVDRKQSLPAPGVFLIPVIQAITVYIPPIWLEIYPVALGLEIIREPIVI